MVGRAILAQADRHGKAACRVDAASTHTDAVHAMDGQAALAAAVRATERAPWSADAWKARGLAELALGRSQPAAAEFRRAVSNDAGDWENWYDLSRALPQGEKRAALGQAMRLNPIEMRLLLRRG